MKIFEFTIDYMRCYNFSPYLKNLVPRIVTKFQNK